MTDHLTYNNYGKAYDRDIREYTKVNMTSHFNDHNVSLPEKFFFAHTKALRKKMELNENMDTMIPYAVVAAHSYAIRSIRHHGIGKYYFDPKVDIHLCIHALDGHTVTELAGQPWMNTQDETHSFLTLDGKDKTPVPPCGEWSFSISMDTPVVTKGKKCAKRVTRTVSGSYDAAYLQSAGGDPQFIDMTIDLHDASATTKYVDFMVPITKAIVQLERICSGSYCVRCVVVYCDFGEPHQHHVHCHPCPRHHHHVHSRHDGHMHDHFHGPSPAIIGAPLKNTELYSDETLKDKLDALFSRFSNAEQDGKHFEYALRDNNNTTSVQSLLQKTYDSSFLYEARGLIHVILAAGLISRLSAIHGPNGMDPPELHDADFLKKTIGEDSQLTAALKKIYAGKKFPTISHLLLHTSGLPSYLSPDPRSIVADIVEGNMTPADVSGFSAVLDRLADNGLVASWEPGSVFHASNVGYTIAGIALSVISGKPVRDVILEDARNLFGMTSARYLRYESIADANSVIPTHSEITPGDLGVESANVGFFVTASDVASFAAAFISKSLAPDVALLTKPIARSSMVLPLFITYGGGLVDDQSYPGSRVVKFESHVERGHSIVVFVFPGRNVSVCYATNVLTQIVPVSQRASLHFDILQILDASGRYPESQYAKSMYSKSEPVVDLTPGWTSVANSQMERLSREENKTRILEEVRKFLSKTRSAQFQSFISDSVGGVRSISFSADLRRPEVVLVTSGDSLDNPIRITPDVGKSPERTLQWKVINPDGLLSEQVFVWDVDVPVPNGKTQVKGVAVSFLGVIYFDAETISALLDIVNARDKKKNDDVDEIRYKTDQKYRESVQTIGAGALWGFLGGLALGGVAGAATAATWRARPAYYTPVYAVPAERPVWWGRPAYVYGDINELERAESAARAKSKDFVDGTKKKWDENTMASSQLIGPRMSGGRGGGGVSHVPHGGHALYSRPVGGFSRPWRGVYIGAPGYRRPVSYGTYGYAPFGGYWGWPYYTYDDTLPVYPNYWSDPRLPYWKTRYVGTW